MALTRWERFGSDLPERWKRWFELGVESDGFLRVEEAHEEGEFVIRAELPGIDPDKDVNVSITDGMLHIQAHREERTEHKEGHGRRSEFRYGEFSRDFALPREVDKEAVKASYKDGILEVRMPWPTEAETPLTNIPIARA